MRRLTLLLLMFFSSVAMAQISIPETPITFDFPKGGWKYLQTTQVDNNTVVFLYSYAETAVVDKTGDTVIPYLRIYVRKAYNKSIYDLAYDRYVSQPFQSIEEYSDVFPGKKGLGYVGIYTDALDHKDYQFRMIYFKQQNIAIEMRLETTSDTYANFSSDFENILKTIKVKGK